MKHLGKFLLTISVIWTLIVIVCSIVSGYQYDKNIYSEWKLADKASSIDQKAIQITAFVDKLSEAGLEGTHDALILKTPDNFFDYNFVALKSLQLRLQDVQQMDPKSFEYNTAMEQITKQEQGQADEMLDVFKGCWYLVHYPFLWSWLLVVQLIVTAIVFIVGLVLSKR